MKIISIISIITLFSFISCRNRYVAVYTTEENGKITGKEYLISDGNWRKAVKEAVVHVDEPIFGDDSITVKLYIYNDSSNFRHRVKPTKNGCNILANGRLSKWRKYYSLEGDTIFYQDDMKSDGYLFYTGSDSVFNVNGKQREAYIFRYGYSRTHVHSYQDSAAKSETDYKSTRYIDKKWNVILADSYLGNKETTLDTMIFCTKKQQEKLLKGIIFENVSDTIYKNEFAKIRYSSRAKELINGTYYYD